MLLKEKINADVSISFDIVTLDLNLDMSKNVKSTGWAVFKVAVNQTTSSQDDGSVDVIRKGRPRLESGI